MGRGTYKKEKKLFKCWSQEWRINPRTKAKEQDTRWVWNAKPQIKKPVMEVSEPVPALLVALWNWSCKDHASRRACNSVHWNRTYQMSTLKSKKQRVESETKKSSSVADIQWFMLCMYKTPAYERYMPHIQLLIITTHLENTRQKTSSRKKGKEVYLNCKVSLFTGP